jgi:hypothetical protein
MKKSAEIFLKLLVHKGFHRSWIEWVTQVVEEGGGKH